MLCVYESTAHEPVRYRTDLSGNRINLTEEAIEFEGLA